MVAELSIAGRLVGRDHPCFLIAEAGVNHNGSLDLAHQLVDAAVEARADAVKFQTFKAERLVTRDAPTAEYQRQAGCDSLQFEMLQRLELDSEAHRRLMAHCVARRIVFLSTPFDEESASMLVDMGVPALKLPSGEITNLPLLAHAAALGRPLILSTGMAGLAEVGEAVMTITRAGARELALLHCVSNYPARAADANLRAMGTLADRFQVPVGYSDHTPGAEVSLAAVALGACIIEKHFTLDRSLPGPDHRVSLEPSELAGLIRGVRLVQAALGDGRKEPVASEQPIAAVARRSLVAACDIPAGAVIADQQVVARRPGTGLPPGARGLVVGRQARVPIAAGTLLTPEMLS